MEKKSGGFSPEELARLAATPAGQQLLALIKNANPPDLEEAMKKAAAGDLTQAKAALAPLLASKEVMELMRQLGG